MKNTIRMAAIGTIAVLALTACGSAPTTETETSAAETSAAASESAEPTAAESTSAAVADFKACIVSDAGGFDDKSFNQLSYEGTKKAADELGVPFGEVQSETDTDFAPNLESMVGENCKLIVSVGFALSAATVESALANPDLEYVLIDDAADNDFNGEKDAPNIKPLLYDTAQAAFLAGYLAAGYTKTGVVGTFGGQPYPTVTIFMDGFKQGVDYYNSTKGTTVKVVGFEGKDQGLFTGGFEANDTAKGIAQQILGQNADVLLPVGGPIYQSAIAAIQDSGKDIALIGVDADFYETDASTQPYVLTSILKKMDTSAYETVKGAGEGTFDPAPYIGTLENGGVDIAPLHNFESKVDPALWQDVQDLKAKIISGEVPVTSYLAQ